MDSWLGLTAEEYISYAKAKSMFVIVGLPDEYARSSRINANIFPIVDAVLTSEEYNTRAPGLAPVGQEIPFTGKCFVLSYNGSYDAAATNAAIDYGFGAAYCCASMGTLPSPAYENYMATIPETPTHTLPAQKMKANWIWELSGALIRSTPDADNLIRVTQAMGFNQVILYCYASQLNGEGAKVSALINRLHAAGITVYGVINGSDVNFSTYQADLSAYLSYNNAYPAARFDGLAFDIEPAITGAAKISALKTLIQQAKALTVGGQTMRSQGLVISIYLDAPYYLAEPNGNASQVAAAKDLYGEFDLVHINCYEDTFNNTLSHAADGPQACQDLGITFQIGLETGELASKPNTLFEEGKATFETIITGLDAYYAGWSGYRGVYVDQWAFTSLWYMISSISVGPITTVTLRRNDHYSSDVIGVRATILNNGQISSALVVMDCSKSTVPNGRFVEKSVSFVFAGLAPGTYQLKIETFDACLNALGYPRASQLLPNISESQLLSMSMEDLAAANIAGKRSPAVLFDSKQVNLEVNMAAYVFPPASPKVAKVPVTVTPAGVPCECEVFVGPNDTTKTATSGKINFTSTGTVQTVSCPITMPTPSNVYHAYINVTSGGYLIVGGVDVSDIVIPGGNIGPIVW